MNRSPDVDLVLRDYFADDGWTAPDHVLEVIEERIMRQPQQRPWRVSWRDSHVNSYLKPLLAVAAVVAIAVAGIAYFGQPSDSGVGGAASPASSPAPSPIASASPSAAPSAGAIFPEWFTPENGSGGAGILPAGGGTTESFLRGSTFVVPENWVNDPDTADFYGLFPNTPANQAEFASSGTVANTIFMGIVDSPSGLICEGVGEAEGSTAEELATSMAASEALVTSEPVEVTVGDLTGVWVDGYLDPEGPASCPNKDTRKRFVFLDIPGGGKLLIMAESAHAADFEAFIAEAMPIIESFEFNLEP